MDVKPQLTREIVSGRGTIRTATGLAPQIAGRWAKRGRWVAGYRHRIRGTVRDFVPRSLYQARTLP